MSEADYRQQQEMDEERMRLELDALVKIYRRGMREVAEFLAVELGITQQFNLEKRNAQGA